MSQDNTPLNIAVLFGSYRSGSNGLRISQYIRDQITARGHTAHDINAKNIDLPMLDRMYKEYAPGTAPENMEALAQTLKNADAFVIVTGEYNHSVQAGLKNMMDHFLEEYFFRPAGIVCYSAGGFGGVRVAMHARAMLGEMGMTSVPSILAVSKVHQTLTEDGRDENGVLRSKRFLDELEWHARALKAARVNGVPY